MAKLDLQARACLVYVRVRNPSFKKTSKTLASEVEQDHGAAEGALGAVVRLVPEVYLKPLAKHAQRLRRIVEFHSAPWAAAGVRILPYSKIPAVKAELSAALADWEETVDRFVHQYSTIRAEAVARLNGLQSYVSDRWPDEDAVRGLFDARVGFMPLADVDGDFRLALAADEAEAMRMDLQAELEANLRESQQDARDRAVVVLQRFIESVGKYKVVADPTAPSGMRTEGAFWQSTVTNVREIAQVCRSLNFLGDAEFDRVCAEMEALGAVDAEHLKLSDGIRTGALTQANSLMAALLR
jgi:hypothetical protein